MEINKDSVTAGIILLAAIAVGYMLPWATFVLAALTIALWIGGKAGLFQGLGPLVSFVLFAFATAGTGIGALLSLFV